MTAEQLEELLALKNGTHDLMKLRALAPSLARRVLAAEKLVDALDDVPLGDGILGQLVNAYREASK